MTRQVVHLSVPAAGGLLGAAAGGLPWLWSPGKSAAGVLGLPWVSAAGSPAAATSGASITSSTSSSDSTPARFGTPVYHKSTVSKRADSS